MSSAREVDARQRPRVDVPNAVELSKFEAFGHAVERGRWDKAFFAERFLGMPLHAGQVEWLEKSIAKTNVLVPGNRWGKSAITAIKHIHKCFYKIGVGMGNMNAWSKSSYTTVNLSPHSDTTRPVFDAIVEILTSSFVITEVVDGQK